MMKFLKVFLIFVVLYHIFVTIIRYWIFAWAYPELPALFRDTIRLLFIAIIFTYNYKFIKQYRRKWKWPRITFAVLLIFGVWISYIKWKSFYDMFVGIKYCFIYLFVFLSATWLWFFLQKHEAWSMKHEAKIFNFISFIKYLLIWTLIIGFIRQILKFIRPDLFLKIWYWVFNDFKFGAKPPIYYLTWYQGTPRRQWIFSWPNNYGYFLIAFLPLIILLFKEKIKNLKEFFKINKKQLLNIWFIILRIIAILLTLSRTAFIGWIVWIAVLNFQRIKKHKRLSIWILIVCLLVIIWLSEIKWTSTIAHIKAKFGSIDYVLKNPGWYGLGTSWPAVHHNWTILPENYFIQLLLDIGTIGFIIRAFLIIQIQYILQKIKKNKDDKKYMKVYLFWIWLNIWRICLLIMWLFLHVFEDSMVNYLFFISRWLTSWYLSTNTNKE